MEQVILVSCAEHMHGGTSCEPDDRALLAALAASGILARVASWDDQTVDWSGSDLCIVRSAWDYHQRLEQFLRWVEEVAAVTTLLNPPPILRWNTRKTYLRALEQVGVPIVPTEWLAKGDQVDLAGLLERRGGSRPC